jgi:hypothetical protein
VNDLQIVLDFYNGELTFIQFVEKVKDSKQLRNIFEKYFIDELHKLGVSFDTWYEKIFCEGIKNSEKSVDTSWRIDAKNYLVKKNISLLKRKDIDDLIMSNITYLLAFYGAEKSVRDYIRKNILSSLTEVKNIKDGVKFAKGRERYKRSYAVVSFGYGRNTDGRGKTQTQFGL